ncbi:MAG TPA: Shedu anti-phage system protein SduA domain-containing protein, partial [Bacteroidia bacterium]
ISKAIIQVENYIEIISKHADSVRSYIKDEHNIDLKVVRPRGIILAGKSTDFDNQKKKDDYRLLTHASKNIIFLTYDELVIRLENYIEVLEKHSVATTV